MDLFKYLFSIFLDFLGRLGSLRRRRAFQGFRARYARTAFGALPIAAARSGCLCRLDLFVQKIFKNSSFPCSKSHFKIKKLKKVNNEKKFFYNFVQSI